MITPATAVPGFVAFHEANLQLAQTLSNTYQTGYGAQQALRMAKCAPIVQPPFTQPHYCHSTCCLLCKESRVYQRKVELHKTLNDFEFSSSTLLYLTVTLADCATAETKSRAEALSTGWNNLMSKQPLRSNDGSFRSLEIVQSGVNPELENVHVHGLLAIPKDVLWQNQDLYWRSHWAELCSAAFPGNLFRDVAVQPFRADTTALRITANYMTFADLKAWTADTQLAIQNPERHMERAQQMHGLSRFRRSKAFKPAKLQSAGSRRRLLVAAVGSSGLQRLAA